MRGRSAAVHALLVCDDVREEVTGKLMLVGVYPGVIAFAPPFPVVLHRLHVVAMIDAVAASGTTATVQLFAPAGRRPVRQGTITLPATAEPISLPLIFELRDVTFDRIGSYRIRLTLDERAVAETRLIAGLMKDDSEVETLSSEAV